MAPISEPPGFGGPRAGVAWTPDLLAAAGVWVGFGSGVHNGATGVGAPDRAGLVGCWHATSREPSARTRNDLLDTKTVRESRVTGAVS
jgi:hypothetical protein